MTHAPNAVDERIAATVAHCQDVGAEKYDVDVLEAETNNLKIDRVCNQAIWKRLKFVLPYSLIEGATSMAVRYSCQGHQQTPKTMTTKISIFTT